MDNVDERRRFCAALLERTGLKIDPDEPAFVLVELNRLVLQEESVKAAEAVTAAGEQANARLLGSAVEPGPGVVRCENRGAAGDS